MRPRSVRQVLVALTSLLAISLVQAQDVTRQLATIQTGRMDTPGPFLMASLHRTQGYLNYDLPLRFYRFPVGYDRQSHPTVVWDPSRSSVKDSADRMPFMSKSLWSQEKYWTGPNTRYIVTLVPPYRSAPSDTHRTAPGVEQYLRHIPTAGPMVFRIYQQTKSHPSITRVLSMVRPDF